MGLNIGEIIEHAQSFIGIANAIRTEASAALDAIYQAIDKHNASEGEILDEWNSVFPNDEFWFESFDELIHYLKTVGI